MFSETTLLENQTFVETKLAKRTFVETPLAETMLNSRNHVVETKVLLLHMQ